MLRASNMILTPRLRALSKSSAGSYHHRPGHAIEDGFPLPRDMRIVAILTRA